MTNQIVDVVTNPSGDVSVPKKTIQTLMDERRFGIFSFQQSVVDKLEPEFAGFVFSYFFITRAEHIKLTGEYLYHAVSPLFEPMIGPPEMVPVYSLNIGKGDDGKLFVVVENLSRKFQSGKNQ